MDYRIQMRSGLAVDPFNLRAEDVRLYDIVWNLKYENRFGGNLGAWSVAQHSLCVHDLVKSWGGSELAVKEALAHDFTEAYLRDIPKPVKMRPEMSGYRMAEADAKEVIFRALGILYMYGHELVKGADELCTYMEAKTMFPGGLHKVWDIWEPDYSAQAQEDWEAAFRLATYGKISMSHDGVYRRVSWQQRWEQLCERYFGGSNA